MYSYYLKTPRGKHLLYIRLTLSAMYFLGGRRGEKGERGKTVRQETLSSKLKCSHILVVPLTAAHTKKHLAWWMHTSIPLRFACLDLPFVKTSSIKGISDVYLTQDTNNKTTGTWTTTFIQINFILFSLLKEQESTKVGSML